jgi:uncharacterized protein (TIGR04255 family)
MSERSRPDGLPDFRSPPLNEVVMGVQFNPIPGYHQIYAGDVWKLFKEEFPNVEEHQALQPAFETFGPPGAHAINLGPVTGGQHDRFWFLNQDKDELIQFQEDRLLHNWRKVLGNEKPYPRFEHISAKFERELMALSGFFESVSGAKFQGVTFNQVELSYINHIEIAPWGDYSEWLKVCNFGDTTPDDLTMIWRRALHNYEGAPYGRLIVDVRSAIHVRGNNIIVLNLTVRGSPESATVDGAMEFLRYARETICQEFATITTDSAHRFWGRVS